MLKKMVWMMVVMVAMGSSLVLAHGKYSIKTMTPAVREALDARKERFSDLRALKASGAIGENNHGYVEALKSSGKVIAAAENHDRKTIYKTIAQQNGLEEALSTIEAAFAQVQADKAESGDKIQTEDGRWISK
ncbi:MAG: YdbL family protein [Candidatus Omnitrophica bacterium]|nr:YdbL family protein [Candidatus Omnitrophota bacterium]